MKDSSLVTSFIPARDGEYTETRLENKIDKICIHHAATTSIKTLDSTITGVSTRTVSVHYGVGGKEVHQYVKESDIAWHATNWNCNKSSIGIETVNSTGRVNNNDRDAGSWKVSDETLATLIKLVADIAKRNNLGTLVPGQNLVWHSMYYSTFCPGDYLRSKMQYIADEANKINTPVIVPEPEVPTQPVSGKKFTKGQKVVLTGRLYYNSKGERPGQLRSNFTCNISSANSGIPIVVGAYAPYNVNNGLGWVREEDLRAFTSAEVYDTYLIKWGDTLSGIAARYGTTVDYLVKINNLADANKISAGKTLKVPHRR